MSNPINKSEYMRRWLDWLKTDDGRGYKAGLGDYPNRRRAARGYEWVLRRMIEARVAEIKRLREALGKIARDDQIARDDDNARDFANRDDVMTFEDAKGVAAGLDDCQPVAETSSTSVDPQVDKGAGKP